MAEVRLSQAVALEKQEKARVNSEGATLHKTNQKSELFSGMSRTYEKLSDEGEDLPPETKRIQASARDNLQEFLYLWSGLVDLTHTKDAGNTQTNIEVLGWVCPPPFLIWMEKQLDDLKTFVQELPTLDPAKSWNWDANRQEYTTEPIRTARHKKEPRVITKAEATAEHPAQAEIVHEDKLVGYWSQVFYSGAITEAEKKRLLGKVSELKAMFKTAREEANSQRVTRTDGLGKAIVGFLKD